VFCQKAISHASHIGSRSGTLEMNFRIAGRSVGFQLAQMVQSGIEVLPCPFDTLPVPRPLHMIVWQSSPTTFALGNLVGLELGPEAKTVCTRRHIGCVPNVVMNNHSVFNFWNAAGD
jgi:hypothetical protein